MTEHNIRETESVKWKTEEPFNLELVRKGVAKGNRHHAMHQYLGWMIRKQYLKVDALVELVTWNCHNQPPIPWKDFIEEFRLCWQEWVLKNNKEMA